MSATVSRLIQQKIEKTKERLENVDESIRKLTGRDVGEWGQMGDQRRVSIGDRGGGNVAGRLGQRGIAGRLGPRRGGGRGRGQSGLGGAGRMETFQRLGMPIRRQSTGSAFSRLGSRIGPKEREESEEDDEEEDTRKPALQSSVVATAPVVKSREDTVKDQQKDKRGQARNKRMFGLLLGTLHKFKQEATHFEGKNVRRAQIEQKLDEKAQEEKQALFTERKELFNERREKQREMVKLEDLMVLANEQEEWDKHSKELANFIFTKAKPRIFYLPKVHTAESLKKLEESREQIKEKIKQRKDDLNKQLEELENERTRRKERIEQREREEKENLKAREQYRSYEGHGQKRTREGKETDQRRVFDTHSRDRRRRSEGDGRKEGHHKRRRTRSSSDDPHKKEGSERRTDHTANEEPASKKLKEVKEEEEASTDGAEVSSGKTGKYEGEVHDGEGPSQAIIRTEDAPGVSDIGPDIGQESTDTAGAEVPDLSSIQLPEGPGVAIPVIQETKEEAKPAEETTDANPSNDFQMGGVEEQLDYNETME